MEWKMEHAIVYPTVDCAIFNDLSYSQVLLARKHGKSLYRFIGGFVDPADDSYEAAALREAKEETGLVCDLPKYVASLRVADPRYEGKEDKIVTALFTALARGRLEDAVAQDDIEEVRAFRTDELHEGLFVPEHRAVFAALRRWLGGWR